MWILGIAMLDSLPPPAPYDLGDNKTEEMEKNIYAWLLPKFNCILTMIINFKKILGYTCWDDNKLLRQREHIFGGDFHVELMSPVSRFNKHFNSANSD